VREGGGGFYLGMCCYFRYVSSLDQKCMSEGIIHLYCLFAYILYVEAVKCA
jgi:hypothetical protein